MNNQFVSAATPSQIAINKVLRNTYLCLSLTLIFSAVMSTVAVITNTGHVNFFLFIIVMFGLIFAINALRNSAWALPLLFCFTGFIGWTLGPMLNFYLKAFSNGPQLIMMALGGTGLIFLLLSAISLNPKRNFATRKMSTFIMVGFVVAIIMAVISFFIQASFLIYIISTIAALASGALILFQTSSIVHGGEKNYIMATISLYISIINIFQFLLMILGMGGNRN